jgi:hypothetical protein
MEGEENDRQPSGATVKRKVVMLAALLRCRE